MILKKIAIVFILLLFFIYTKAQKKGFSAGFYIGVVTTQVDGDNLAGYKKFGFTGGIKSILNFDKTWALNTDIAYVPKGSVEKDAKNAVYYKLALHYVEIPVYINYHNHSKKLKQFSFDAGLTIAYLFKSGEDKDGYGYIDPFPSINKFDFNVLSGANWHMSEKLIVGVRLQYSIIPIRNIAPNPLKPIFERGQYNNLLAINIYKLF